MSSNLFHLFHTLRRIPQHLLPASFTHLVSSCFCLSNRSIPFLYLFHCFLLDSSDFYVLQNPCELRHGQPVRYYPLLFISSPFPLAIPNGLVYRHRYHRYRKRGKCLSVRCVSVHVLFFVQYILSELPFVSSYLYGVCAHTCISMSNFA